MVSCFVLLQAFLPSNSYVSCFIYLDMFTWQSNDSECLLTEALNQSLSVLLHAFLSSRCFFHAQPNVWTDSLGLWRTKNAVWTFSVLFKVSKWFNHSCMQVQHCVSSIFALDVLCVQLTRDHVLFMSRTFQLIVSWSQNLPRHLTVQRLQSGIMKPTNNESGLSDKYLMADCQTISLCISSYYNSDKFSDISRTSWL